MVATRAAASSSNVPFGFYDLAAQYGLTDMDIVSPSNDIKQTVEQEYQSYITAQLTPPSVKILDFWAVRCVFASYVFY
jgi:hypothetical protein